MKRFLLSCFILIFISGCSHDSKSVNRDAQITFVGEPIEVGTRLSESQILSEIETKNLAEHTILKVLFSNNETQITFNEVGDVDVSVQLSVGDDVITKNITITVQDTQAPVILGAIDREVALNQTVDLASWVSTRNPNDTITFDPATIDTSTLGTTTITAQASDANDTVTTRFDIIVTDFQERSNFRFWGQTYGDLDAINLNSSLVLVNKRHGLGSSYTPNDLITIDDAYAFQGRQGIQVVEVAYDAFVALNEAMVEETGMSPLSISTAYRSYSFQKTLYTNYVNSDGIEAADTYSARPGFSEHQTGLAIDIAAENKNLDAFGETQQAQYVKENAARFGFIIRFPEDKERITGYQHESWHIRYVGVDYASAIEASGLTLDQYLFAYNLTDLK